MFDEVKQLLFDTLKGAFTRDTERKRTRKIIFWYDPKEEYKELVDELLVDESFNKDTEILIYNNNSIWIRYHVEKEELNKNIIIYLPMEKPRGNDNDLLDLESSNYDLMFNPDSTTMRLKNLGLKDECRKVIKSYDKFFNNKKRENDFKEFDCQKDEDNIDYIITAILLNIKSINPDDILKNIVKLYFEDLKKYEEIFKFGNEEFILKLFNKNFGSSVDNIDGLPELYKSLVFTYFASTLKDTNKVGKYSKYLLKDKFTNVYVFVNSLMRDKLTKEYYDILAMEIEKEFGINELIKDMDIDNYIKADAFKIIDRFVLAYITDKLFNDIGEYDKYNEYLDLRENKYWFDVYFNEYNFLRCAIKFFKKIKTIKNDIKTEDIDSFAKNYISNLYEVDTLYRKIYFYFDNIEDKDMFINLKNRIENIYVNDFISELSIKWSESIESLDKYDSSRMLMQNKFYDHYIKPYNDKKDRIIVIVSDAFRYECAKELNDKLKVFGKTSEIEYMQGLIPTYTKLGMASLLPNKILSIGRWYAIKFYKR